MAIPTSRSRGKREVNLANWRAVPALVLASRAPCRHLPWRGVLTVSVLATLYFLALGPAKLSLDSIRELALARDCAEGAHCLSQGAGSSFDGFVQGGLWIRLLAGARLAGLGSDGLYLLISLA